MLRSMVGARGSEPLTSSVSRILEALVDAYGDVLGTLCNGVIRSEQVRTLLIL